MVALNAQRWDGSADRVPFVLVHGLASNARLWDGVGAALSALGHPVVAVDLRGHGRSPKPDDGYDVATVASDVVPAVELLSLSAGGGPVVVVGQSWGGNVVLELAARWPSLPLAGVGCIDGGWLDLRSRFPSWDECARVLAPPRTVGRPFSELETFFRARHADWPESGIQGALACFEVREDGTVAPWFTFERHMLALRGLWEHDVASVFPRVSVPVLLMPCEGESGIGKRDAVAAAEGALPRSRTHWFVADHDVHAQHPDAVASLLVEEFAS
jgi:pimeloyl-ACP methyl ester carboxylesterase